MCAKVAGADVVLCYNTLLMFDNLAAGYDAHYLRSIDLAENQVVFKLFESYLRFGDTVLDLGCGTCLIGKYINLRKYNYIGIDNSAVMLEIAREKVESSGEFMLADMHDLSSIPDGSVDVVISTFGSMSYCTDLQLVICEVRRVLKQGGRFGLMFCGWRYYHRKNHIADNHNIICYSAQELAHSFREDVDLRFVGINYCNDAVVSFLPVWVLTFLFRVQSMRRDVDNAYFITVFGEKRSG